jgi:GNAT superfamily N-acetyltransferase
MEMFADRRIVDGIDPEYEEDVIIFRHLGKTLPFELEADNYWQIEYHIGHGWRGFPSGLAWVRASPPGQYLDEYLNNGMLMYVLVFDDERRKGVAYRLLQECLTRWPDLDLTDAHDEIGENLLEKVEEYRKVINPHYVNPYSRP